MPILGLRAADLPPGTTVELDAQPQWPFRLQWLTVEGPPGTVVLDICFDGEPLLSRELVNPSAGCPAELFSADADSFANILCIPASRIPRIDIGGHITLKVRTGAEGGDVVAALAGETD